MITKSQLGCQAAQPEIAQLTFQPAMESLAGFSSQLRIFPAPDEAVMV